MFKFLKEKINKWTKKISEDTEEKIEEIPKEIPKIKKDKKKVKESKKIEEIPKEINKSTDIPEETVKEVAKESIFQKIKKNFSEVKINEEKFNEYSEELEFILLENNVALSVVEKITNELKKSLLDKEIKKNEIESEIKKNLADIISSILKDSESLEEEIKNSEEPYVILFCGINGTGKTTTIAKLAWRLKNQGISCIMAAGDTFRAASIEQIKLHSEKIGIKLISQDYGSDPASVGFDAIKYAKKNGIKCVLIDTAGRMYNEKNLMKEIAKIVKVCKPNKKIFIGESIAGNDSVDQIKAFDEEIGIDSIILSKSDIDEKGGTALSLSYVTGKPIVYLGTGQEYKDLEKFDKKDFIKKLGL